jgi:hypothetical protein
MFFEVGRGAAHHQAQRPQAASDEGRIGRRERADPQIERLLHQVDHRVAGAQIDRRFRVPGQEIADNRGNEPPDALVAIDAQLATRGCLLRAGGLVRLLQVLQELHAPARRTACPVHPFPIG